MKKALSLILALVMLIGMLPRFTLLVRAEETKTITNELEGKTISILGASISTYAGTSNGAAADTTNSTIRDNAKYYPHSVVTDVTLSDTWWMQVCNDLNLRLLVNNSWSGSSLLHTRNGTVGAYVDRCVQLHDDTGDNAGEEPDIIGIQMGTNDFQYYKDTLGTADIDYDVLITENEDGSYTYATPVTSLEAAAIVLHKISIRYPNAEVYYLNISQRVDGTDDLLQSFNSELKEVVEHFGAHIVDIYGSVITMDDFDTYIGDGRVHPNCLGMDAYTEAFKRTLLENTAYKVETHTVSMNLESVTADYGDNKIVVSGNSFVVKLTAAAEMGLDVTVTMGGKNITSAVYANGSVIIDSVTDDVSITAKAVHVPKDYRWEFDGTDLACVNGENTLTKSSGTTTDGVFSNTSYALENEVVLLHDLPWVVEWSSEGTFENSGSSTGARIFSSDNVNANYNARYIFKSNKNGIVAMGEKTNTGSHNYGIALADHGIDWTAPHTYRLENRISDDGGNMIYLFVDGAEIGPMNNYYIGTTSQNTTSDWLSGKDFVFPYMGTDNHGFTNCSIDYIEVREAGRNLLLRFDDHYDVTGKTVEIIDAGTPTSYQVGYGVEENTVFDTAVVTLEGNTLVATGIGTATVKIDGVTYEITVTAAPISLLLLIGQSNMQGSEGDENQSIVCPDGMVYTTYGDRYTMTTSNATNFAPSALTGAGSEVNVNGTTTNLEEWPIYLLNERGVGKKGPDSGFAYEWVKQTGEKVWIVNAAHGGSSINTWQDGGANYEECVLLFKSCMETLQKEIDAGHFTLSHMGYFWCQGCTDYSQTAEWYVNKYLTMHDNLKTELAFDENTTFEFGGIIPVRAGHEYYTSYRQGIYADTTSKKYHESFKDLRFTGPRVAQYWMINNPDLPDIWGVCNIGESWVWMPDGTNGVTDYFQAHYENGTVDYTTQVQQSESWYTPTTPAAVHDSIHYNQIGYNEVGRESARNALIMLGEIEAPNVETSVKFLGWDGYTEVTEISAATAGNSGTLVVPMVYPLWKSKEVTYTVTEGLIYEYYDLLADSPLTDGKLCVIGSDLSVIVSGRELSSYSWELEDGLLVSSGETENKITLLSGSFENGVFIDTQYQLETPITLLHDQNWVLEWKMTGPWYDDATTSQKLFCQDSASASANAWCLLIKGNENRITIGYYGTTTHISYGLDLDNYGISMADTHVYRLVNHINDDGTNTIYLFVDGVQIGPMTHYFTGSGGDMGEESDYLSGKDISFGYLGTPKYLLNAGVIEYISVVESGASQDIHFHDWSDWETVTAPNIDGPGLDQRTCTGCGETETTVVESIWQTTNIADHWNELPENVCKNLNLWSVLEHDDKYYVVSKGDWGYHSSRNVPSVTFAVNPGDQIFATSFGAADVNGHGSSNGIRVTFFDINGVVKTMTPAETYAEFVANGGYLIVPEGAIAVNIPLWNDSDDNEIYILNRDHNYTSVVTAPTCTEQGYTTHTCASCGDTYVDSYTIALGHDWDEGVVIIEPTEESEGERLYTCQACSETRTEVIPTLDHVHSYDAVVTAPSCTEQGYTTHTCACGESYVDDYVAAIGHSFGEWLTTDEPTCTEKGTEARVCPCGEIEYREIAAAGHNYENGVCTACGTAHPNLANYEGKVISILGDSISTFAGYIPTADGFNLEHLARYPQDNLLTDVNETWWMQVIANLHAKLGINDSWRGATVSGAKPVTTGTTGENAAMHNLTRIQNLGANGTPDVILFYGGTNDLAHVSKIGTFDPANAPNTVDLTTTQWDNLADGYVHTLLRLKYFYPDAQIIAMLPTYTNGYYSDGKLAEGNAVLAAICEHYGITYVDLRECGISTADLPDNIHPNATGMDYITAAVMDALMNACEVEAGENVVYSVTHNLSNAESSLGYYKGVTHGKSFVATITGEDVKVTVTMGGKDVTDAVYANGVITILEVTGDLVITAEGSEKLIYEDHLQQLPENICPGTNLWVELTHDAQYYTVNGWGIHSSGTVYSVTFSVNAGDHIYATSFNAAGSNGSSINGIRVTWFDAKGVLKSMSADEVYAEFAANGYLSAPEGAVAVCIPMWKVSEDNEIYILNREHTYTSVVTAPTCTERGYTTHTCANCGDSYIDSYVEANGHSYVVTDSVEATCTEDGYVTYTCHCGDSYTEVIEAAGHSYVDGVCENCGEADPDAVLMGDANGDGVVNYLDAMLIAQYYVGMIANEDLNLLAADVNGDGTINYVDAMLVAQFYVGDIETLP